jgi:hypothetical protein
MLNGRRLCRGAEGDERMQGVKRLGLPAIALAWCLAAPAHAADSAIVDMHGFKVDFRLTSPEQKQTVWASLNKQFDIVESAGVPQAVLKFFRTVPIVVDPELTRMYGEVRRIEGREVMRIKPAELPEDRPIVLHELLHAYHFEKLGPTPAIRDAHLAALRDNLYPDKYRRAHFLENPKEYFAVIGSIFLFGKKIDQPPFDCSIPAKRQPQFIRFLSEQFGPHACR